MKKKLLFVSLLSVLLVFVAMSAPAQVFNTESGGIGGIKDSPQQGQTQSVVDTNLNTNTNANNNVNTNANTNLNTNTNLNANTNLNTQGQQQGQMQGQQQGQMQGQGQGQGQMQGFTSSISNVIERPFHNGVESEIVAPYLIPGSIDFNVAAGLPKIDGLKALQMSDTISGDKIMEIAERVKAQDIFTVLLKNKKKMMDAGMIHYMIISKDGSKGFVIGGALNGSPSGVAGPYGTGFSALMSMTPSFSRSTADKQYYIRACSVAGDPPAGK